MTSSLQPWRFLTPLTVSIPFSLRVFWTNLASIGLPVYFPLIDMVYSAANEFNLSQATPPNFSHRLRTVYIS